MAEKRKVEVFSAGCSFCSEAVSLVQRLSCPSCEVSVLDMNDQNVADRAHELGVASLPAVVVDGKLTDCCLSRGIDEGALRRAGIGQPM